VNITCSFWSSSSYVLLWRFTTGWKTFNTVTPPDPE
jgi:hypothetical protein